MVKKIFAQTYLWILLLLLYSPIVIIMIYSFTEAKVLGNWTGFSTKLYSSLFTTGTHHSLMNALINTVTIALIAATASTLLGSITAIGIFNSEGTFAEGHQLCEQHSYPEWGYYYRYFTVSVVCVAGDIAGIYDRCTGTHHFLYSLCGTQRVAPSQADES